MVSESKNYIKNNHDSVSVSKNNFSQQEFDKIGFIKRFLNWITKGVHKSKISGSSFPGQILNSLNRNPPKNNILVIRYIAARYRLNANIMISAIIITTVQKVIYDH